MNALSWLRIAAGLAAACCAPVQAQQAVPSSGEVGPVIFIEADFVASDSPRPPPDSAEWMRVRLPDNWHQSRPDARGAGWYRIELPLTDVPRWVYGIFLPRDAAAAIGFWLNGSFIGGTARPDVVVRQNHQPYLTGAPPALFRQGRNVLHIRVQANPDLRQGLTRVWFGHTGELRAIWLKYNKLHVLLVVAFGLVSLAAGVAALALWTRARRDLAVFWFGLSALLLGAPTLIGFAFGPLSPGPMLELWRLVQAYAYAPALAIGTLYLAGAGSRGRSLAVWLLFMLGLAVPTVLGEKWLAGAFAVLGVPLVLLLSGSIILMIARSGSALWLRAAAAGALAIAIGLALHDLSHWLGWIDFDRIALLPFAAPPLTLSVGALLAARHFDAMRELAESKASLESRVVERTAQIEQAHEHLRALESEQATVRERQRIMADMHDGLGASLVGLLGAVQTGSAGRDELERRAHAALQELRLAVDSLDTPPGDLNMALGTVRHRLRDPIEASGVAFDWQVADLPRLAHFSPSRILHLQRILFEAVNNALRHAGAKRIAVDARADADAVEVSVTDDGRGLNGAKATGGRGMMIMQRRASALGGSLDVWSPGAGTRVTLRFPLAAPSM